jgi:hypothetical protein
MRLARFFALLAALIIGGTVLASPAMAGSAHFVDDKVQATQSGDTLTVTFKEAGLGDEPQVHVVLTADAACINPGDNHPKAANKEAVTAAGDFPVQNGRVDGSLSVTAVFAPSSPCPDPMVIMYSNVVLTDVTNGISVTL